MTLVSTGFRCTVLQYIFRVFCCVGSLPQVKSPSRLPFTVLQHRQARLPSVFPVCGCAHLWRVDARHSVLLHVNHKGGPWRQRRLPAAPNWNSLCCIFFLEICGLWILLSLGSGLGSSLASYKGPGDGGPGSRFQAVFSSHRLEQWGFVARRVQMWWQAERHSSHSTGSNSFHGSRSCFHVQVKGTQVSSTAWMWRLRSVVGRGPAQHPCELDFCPCCSSTSLPVSTWPVPSPSRLLTCHLGLLWLLSELQVPCSFSVYPPGILHLSHAYFYLVFPSRA